MGVAEAAVLQLDAVREARLGEEILGTKGDGPGKILGLLMHFRCSVKRFRI